MIRATCTVFGDTNNRLSIIHLFGLPVYKYRLVNKMITVRVLGLPIYSRATSVIKRDAIPAAFQE
jgi:hypothetical protein